jgi:hypothetical protein
VAEARPLPRRARLGHGTRGLQRGRRRVDVLPARPRAVTRLPLERGRARRHLRREPAPLLRARVLERPRPHPQGADLRSRRPRGEPRRGRQGVLVVPRLDPDPLVPALALRLPAGGVPVRRAARGERAPRPRRAGVRAARHRRLRRRPLLGDRGRLREGVARRRARAPRGAEPRAGAGDAPRPAAPLVPQHVVVGARRPQARAVPRGRPDRRAPPAARHALPRGGRRARGALLRERVERAAPLGHRRAAVSEGRDRRPRRPRRADRQPGAHRHEGGLPLRARGRAGRERDRRAPPRGRAEGDRRRLPRVD